LKKTTNRKWWENTRHLSVTPNGLQICSNDVQNLAKEFGTPLYIYNLDEVQYNYCKVVNILKEYAPPTLETRVYYAMKANGASEILQKLHKENAFIDTSAIGEIKKALEAGYSSDQLIFTGTNFGLDGFEYLAKSGVLINVDSFSQLERLRSFAPLNISIRLNPSIGGVGFNEKFDMSGIGVKASRLGIYIDRIVEAFHTARSYGLNPICLHQHVGSNWFRNSSFNAYMQSVDTALKIVKQLEYENFDIQILNLGGGLGVRSNEKYTEFPLQEYAKCLMKTIEKAQTKIKCLAIEPGRYIVGNTGILVTTANLVEKKNQTNYLGVDIGFNAFHHKFMYGIENTIINLSKINEPDEVNYAVVGYLGEQGDIFSEDETLPDTEEGDIIMLYPAGAYCASELATHHLLPIPKELFLETNNNYSDLSLANFCKICPKNCCYGSVVNLTPKEYETISSRIGKNDIFTLTKDNIIQINSLNSVCPLLDKDGYTCTIQDIKPIECKIYPLLVNDKLDTNEIIFGKKCPAKSFLTDNFIKNALVELSNYPKDMLPIVFDNNKKDDFF
jgi:diaminopimelate decarboxylase